MTDFDTAPTDADHFTENGDGVTLADLKTTLSTLATLREEYFHTTETFPDSIEALEGTLQAYEASATWLHTGVTDDTREVRLSFTDICACTPARKYEQTGWSVSGIEWDDEHGLRIEFAAPDYDPVDSDDGGEEA